jgi:WD40 repeat protein
MSDIRRRLQVIRQILEDRRAEKKVEAETSVHGQPLQLVKAEDSLARHLELFEEQKKKNDPDDFVLDYNNAKKQISERYEVVTDHILEYEMAEAKAKEGMFASKLNPNSKKFRELEERKKSRHASRVASRSSTPHTQVGMLQAMPPGKFTINTAEVSQSPQPEELLTERSKYSKENAEASKSMVNLLMQLDAQAMQKIRREFKKLDWELSIYDFVLLLQAYLTSQDDNIGSEHIDALCEMFREIDVNGDGSMEWDEFTAHLVELASTYYGDFLEDNAPHYSYMQVEDTTPHDYHCDYVRYIPEINKIVLFERNSRRFKLYVPNLTCTHVVRGHRGQLLACEYLPEHQLLVTSSEDKTLIFWETKTGQQRYMTQAMRWTTKRSQVCLKWMDRLLYTADTTGTISAWSVERAEQKLKFVGHTDIVMAMCPLPSLGMFASCSLDLTIRIWDSTREEMKVMLRGHEKGIINLAYSEKYKFLFSGGLDPYVLVWTTHPNIVMQPTHKLERPNPLSHIIGLEIPRDTPELVVGDSSGQFTVYDIRTFSILQSFQIPKLKTPSISCFTSHAQEGTLIVSGDKLHKFQRTSGVKGKVADDNPIVFACYNPVTMTILTAAGANLKIWDALTGRLERVDPNVVSDSVTAVCLDDRNRRVVVGSHTGEIKVYNYSNGAWMKDLKNQKTEVSQLAFCNQRGEKYPKQVISASWDGSLVSHHDKMNCKDSTIRHLNDHRTDISCLKADVNLGLIAVGCVDKTLTLYEWGLGSLLAKFTTKKPVSNIVFLTGYPLLAASDDAGVLSLFSCTTPYSCVHSIPGFNRDPTNGKSHTVMNMCYDSVERVLFTADDAGIIKRWPMNIAFLQKFKHLEGKETWRQYIKPVKQTKTEPELTTRDVLMKRKPKKRMSVITPKHKLSRPDPTKSKIHFVDWENSFIKPSNLTIKAHTGPASINFIAQKDTGLYPALISWSYDGSVHLWNALTGENVGSLFQGHNKRHTQRTEKWRFELNLDAHKKREAVFLSESLMKPVDEASEASESGSDTGFDDHLLEFNKESKEEDMFHLTSAPPTTKNRRDRESSRAQALSPTSSFLDHSRGPSLLRKVATGYKYDDLESNGGDESDREAAARHRNRDRHRRQKNGGKKEAKTKSLLTRLNHMSTLVEEKPPVRGMPKQKRHFMMKVGRHEIKVNKRQLDAANHLDAVMRKHCA